MRLKSSSSHKVIDPSLDGYADEYDEEADADKPNNHQGYITIKDVEQQRP